MQGVMPRMGDRGSSERQKVSRALCLKDPVLLRHG